MLLDSGGGVGLGHLGTEGVGGLGGLLLVGQAGPGAQSREGQAQAHQRGEKGGGWVGLSRAGPCSGSLDSISYISSCSVSPAVTQGIKSIRNPREKERERKNKQATGSQHHLHLHHHWALLPSSFSSMARLLLHS